MGGFVDLEVHGTDELLAAFDNIGKNAKAVAVSGVSAALSVLASAARRASPGTVGRECGKRLSANGDVVSGRAGLMRFPRRGDGQNGPHGVYLDQGTRYIAARGFIGSALSQSRGAAIAAFKRAGERRLTKLSQNKE